MSGRTNATGGPNPNVIRRLNTRQLKAILKSPRIKKMNFVYHSDHSPNISKDKFALFAVAQELSGIRWIRDNPRRVMLRLYTIGDDGHYSGTYSAGSVNLRFPKNLRHFTKILTGHYDVLEPTNIMGLWWDPVMVLDVAKTLSATTEMMNQKSMREFKRFQKFEDPCLHFGIRIDEGPANWNWEALPDKEHIFKGNVDLTLSRLPMFIDVKEGMPHVTLPDTEIPTCSDSKEYLTRFSVEGVDLYFFPVRPLMKHPYFKKIAKKLEGK